MIANTFPPASAKATAGKPDPEFLATAIEAVVRAGDLQMAKFGTGVRVEKKGVIDLVTEVDLEVEKMFRALVAERFPDHDVLAEEMDIASSGARHRWVFDPLDGTTNFAHGVPIFCASLALEIDGVPEVAAVYDPNRKELFTAARGSRRRRTRPCSSRCWSPASRTTFTRRPTSS